MGVVNEDTQRGTLRLRHVSVQVNADAKQYPQGRLYEMSQTWETFQKELRLN
jgi:hypothetical protein